MLAVAVAAALGSVVLAAQQMPQPPGPPATGTGMIIGQVVDADSGHGIAGATLISGMASAATGAGRAMGIVVADSQGRFFLSALPAGTYLLLPQRDGYSPLPIPRTIDLKDGERVTGVKVRLRKLGIIAGVVRDDGGDPVVGVEVFALRRTSFQGRPPTLGGAGRAKTDDRGQYRFTNLPPGDYYLCACSRDPIPFDGQLLTTLAARPLELLAVAGRAAKAGADAASLDATLRTYAPTFHPNTTLASRATRVRVSGAEPQTAIDIEVSAVRAVRVSGMVLGTPDAGFVASAIRLIPAGDIPEAAAITQIVPMLVQPDGRFDFASVAPGQYALEVRFTPGLGGGGPSGAALAFIGGRGTPTGGRGGGPPADSMWATQTIAVGDEDVSGLVIGLQPGASVTGRLEFSGSTPPPAAQAMSRGNGVQLSSLESPPRASSYTGSVAADGAFRIAGVVPGRYVAFPVINVPGWPTIKSVTLDGADVTDTIIDIDGRDVRNLVVTVTDVPMAEIRGTLSTSPASPEADTWVCLFPAERRYWDEPFGAFARFKSVPVEKDSFILARVPEGEYFVLAMGEGGLDWMDKVTLEAMSRAAERVRVVNGDKKTIEVKR